MRLRTAALCVVVFLSTWVGRLEHTHTHTYTYTRMPKTSPLAITRKSKNETYNSKHAPRGQIQHRYNRLSNTQKIKNQCCKPSARHEDDTAHSRSKKTCRSRPPRLFAHTRTHTHTHARARTHVQGLKVLGESWRCVGSSVG